jgi:hypothetical protein
MLFDLHFHSEKKNVRQHSPYNVWVRHVSTVHTTRAHLLIKASYHISDTSKTATPTESKVDFHFSLSFPVAELSFLCTCPHKKKYFAYIYICVICTHTKRKYMLHMHVIYIYICMPMCQ